eukprot:TRINITY_DN748_c0_g1_i1.p1 TRINITY_DN748_c0_g1~~TRINITY_DN748_c0_g1_i1.p1  ORF type:complete len:174 (-),score=52.33 TRINITY_DN748_c0_g1_i1:5-526(-)
MIRRPPRSTLSSSSAASDVYKRQGINAEYGESSTADMALHRLALLAQLLLPIMALDMSRPWQFSPAGLQFAKDAGTGFFYTTGSFKGSMTLGYKDVCNYGSCFKVPSAKLRSNGRTDMFLSLIHISEPTRLLSISYAVFCLKKKKKKNRLKSYAREQAQCNICKIMLTEKKYV